jgi:hypothetical protein
MIGKMSNCSKRLLRLLLCFLLLYMQLIDEIPKLIAADEQSTKAKLDQAEESYYNGDPRQSIMLVQQCLDDSLLSKDNRMRAHKIQARSYLTLEEFDLAKEAVLLLLELDPAYQPTIEEESPRFISLVNEARAEYARLQADQAKQKTSIKPWIWMGAGGVAVTAIIVLVASSSGGGENNNTNQPLPAPPPLP